MIKSIYLIVILICLNSLDISNCLIISIRQQKRMKPLPRPSNNILPYRRKNNYVSMYNEINMSSLPLNEMNLIATKSYEAQLSSENLIAIVSTSVILCVTTYFWWNSVIPTQRTKLAKSKRNGEVKEYLNELRASGTESVDAADRKFEKWLFSDWLNTKQSAKPGAIPFLKKAKWNSGDNPILVAFGAIMACVIAASFAERGHY